MDVAPHQPSDGIVHQPVPRKRGQAAEPLRHDDDVEMPAFACTGVPGVQRAVVADLEGLGPQRGGQCRPQAIGTSHGCGGGRSGHG